MNRYCVEISVIAVAESPSIAAEQALRGEGSCGASWTEEPTVTRSKGIEG
jgi:hypothetical protein